MWCLCAEQDSLSQEVEVGAAGHLAFEGFDVADGALGGAAAVDEGEPVGDGGLVATDAPKVKACRQGRSSRSPAVIHADRRSWWRPVIISAKAVTWPAVAFSCGLRALIFASLAVSSSVSWPGVAGDLPGDFPGRSAAAAGAPER